jgi:hypothetical protein
MNELSGIKIIQAALYSKFDQRIGPIPVAWSPSLDKDLVGNYAITSMNFISGSEYVPEKLAILPLPDAAAKIVVRCIVYRDPGLRGFRGLSAISIIIGEASDAILYKYLIDLEKVFDEYAKIIVDLEESKHPVKQALVDAFFKTMTHRLDNMVTSSSLTNHPNLEPIKKWIQCIRSS